MPSKYMVIDDDEVELGSFNDTKEAEENDAENGHFSFIPTSFRGSTQPNLLRA
jgi:hypothetical protein